MSRPRNSLSLLEEGRVLLVLRRPNASLCAADGRDRRTVKYPHTVSPNSRRASAKIASLVRIARMASFASLRGGFMPASTTTLSCGASSSANSTGPAMRAASFKRPSQLAPTRQVEPRHDYHPPPLPLCSVPSPSPGSSPLTCILLLSAQAAQRQAAQPWRGADSRLLGCRRPVCRCRGPGDWQGRRQPAARAGGHRSLRRCWVHHPGPVHPGQGRRQQAWVLRNRVAAGRQQRRRRGAADQEPGRHRGAAVRRQSG